MAKKVIGIILIVISVFTIFSGVCFLLTFGLLGGAFGVVGAGGGLSVEEGATVETVVGEVYDVDDGYTTVCYEVDGIEYMGSVTVTNSAYTEGTPITVEYDSTDPSTFAVPELSAVFGVLGSVFGGVGVVLGVGGLILGIVMLIVGIILVKKSKKAAATATAM
ncbi:MAG: hypothetical protein IJZ42_10945 [Lachnospiraceae bacterium]|nr:hypothetical protein [Lachnospiraceae bacterium]